MVKVKGSTPPSTVLYSLSTKGFPVKLTFQNPRKHISPPLPFLLAEKEKESVVDTHSKLTKKMALKESRRHLLIGSFSKKNVT